MLIDENYTFAPKTRKIFKAYLPDLTKLYTIIFNLANACNKNNTCQIQKQTKPILQAINEDEVTEKDDEMEYKHRKHKIEKRLSTDQQILEQLAEKRKKLFNVHPVFLVLGY